MNLGPWWIQVGAFLIFAFMALGGALGVTSSLSAFRAGVLLMASSFGVAGLLILLMADLLALLHVLVFTLSSIVTTLFLVMFTRRPGGEARSPDYRLARIQALFSQGLPENAQSRQAPPPEVPRTPRIPQLPPPPSALRIQAGALCVLIGIVLAAFLMLRDAWPVVPGLPGVNTVRAFGLLLTGKYLLLLHGSAVLILLAVFAAVTISRPRSGPPPSPRHRFRAAIHRPPAPARPERIRPIFETDLPHRPHREEEEESL